WFAVCRLGLRAQQQDQARAGKRARRPGNNHRRRAARCRCPARPQCPVLDDGSQNQGGGITMDLPLIWFVLLGILLAGYAILDGFDLGVGMLHLLVRDDTERRILLNSIGPVWDGNEVWLVVFGGATFAAFPDAYATAFSGFYLPFMLLLLALIS